MTIPLTPDWATIAAALSKHYGSDSAAAVAMAQANPDINANSARVTLGALMTGKTTQPKWGMGATVLHLYYTEVLADRPDPDASALAAEVRALSLEVEKLKHTAAAPAAPVSSGYPFDPYWPTAQVRDFLRFAAKKLRGKDAMVYGIEELAPRLGMTRGALAAISNGAATAKLHAEKFTSVALDLGFRAH